MIKLTTQQISDREAPNNSSDWSQMKETVLLLNVAVARIEYAMIEGNDSVTTLTESFVETVNAAKQITEVVEELDDSPAKNIIRDNCEAISQRVGNSIVAFQFYDKLSQRMTHVSRTLSSLTEILNDPAKISKPDEWLELQNNIRSKYTLDADQKIFDDVLGGMPIEEALKMAQQSSAVDDIELF